jgi:hypothetical protein
VKWGVLVAVAASVSDASADPRTVQLSYVGDACSAEDLVERVRELVGRDPFVEKAALQIDVHVEAGLRATVTIAGRGQRELAALTCGELNDALAVVIAIDVAGDQPTVPIAAHAVERPPAASAQVVSDRMRVAAAARRPDAPRTVSLVAGVAASTHGMWSGSAGVRVGRGWWSIEGVFGLGAPETYPMIDVIRGGATVAACVHVGPATACPMASVGWVTGLGHDLVRADTVTTPAATAGMRLAVEHGLFGGIGVRARIDGTVSMTSTTFTVDDRMVWESPRGELALGIDVLARIP